MSSLTVAQMAKLADVSERLMHQVLYAHRHGIPALSDLMASGTLSAHRAWQIARLDVDDQQRVIGDIRAGKEPELPRAADLQSGGYSRLVKAWNQATEDARGRFLETITAMAEGA